jgi:DNA polymerase-3 subunit gamma/tau
MRGATSPRLLLELMCAQVLLPAAATDEKSLLARLERLEQGAPQAVPPSPRRAPQPAPHDDAERAQDTRPAARPAPEPARAQPAPPAPAPEVSAPKVSAPPAPEPAAAASSPADSLRRNWDAVLDVVKRERRVAWMLLSNASVLSVEDGILTLRFPRDGDLKGFSVSGHDAILKRVLSGKFGLNVTVRGVRGRPHGRRRGAGRARTGPGGQPAARPGPPGSRSGAAGFRPAGVHRAARRLPARREPRGRAVAGRPGGPRSGADRDGPHPARAGRPGDRRDRGLS